jgi:hypothetical protein
MALIPTYETQHELEGYVDQDLFTEGQLRTVLRQGFYRDPSMSDYQLIEREVVTSNQYGRVFHRVYEHWEYITPGGSPRQYRKEVWSTAYVPEVNPGRGLKLMEETIKVFWTFAPWAKDALAYRAETNAWVVYDLKPVEDLDSEAQQKLQDKGQKADGATDEQKRYHVASGRLWSEAVERGSVVERTDANQTARWVEGVVVEECDVTEEIDRYSVWTTTKMALRPGDVRVDGPRYVQKEDYTYTLDVEVGPPTIAAQDTTDRGVRLEARGGGANIGFPLQTGTRHYDRKPDKYKFFRKKVAEADREPDGDPFGLWDDEHAPVRRLTVLGNVFVRDYDGQDLPQEGLPSPTSHSEPHDPSPLPDEGWRHVADADNQNPDLDYGEGFAVVFDNDVRSGGTYAYAAVAVVQSSESALSAPAEVEVATDTKSRGSVVIVTREDGTLEGDYEVPDDPQLQPLDEFGEVAEFDVPAMVTDMGWPGIPIDCTQLTAAATVNTSTKTFTTNPREQDEAWAAGAVVQLTDTVGPGDPRYGSNTVPYSLVGTVKSKSDTTVEVEGLQADGHEYPVGSSLCVLAESQDLRIDLETGDEFDGTMQALVLGIGLRQGLRNLTSSYEITVDLLQPVLGLHAGQHVALYGVNWDAFGNNVWMRSYIEDRTWVLKGWSIKVARNADGTMDHSGTRLVLEQR